MSKKEMFVIIEKDLRDDEEILIGIADSKQKTEDLITEYYGDDIKNKNYLRHIGDSGVVNTRYLTLSVEGIRDDWRVRVTVLSCNLNELM